MYDVCVIGGGASGMSAAITAARKGAKVIILEKNSKLGRKLYATGNGRCNLSNTYMDYENVYFSGNDSYVSFLKDAMKAEPEKELCEFMESIGVLTYDRKSYVYPVSNQASAVVWAMTDELAKHNVLVMLKTEIESIEVENISCAANNIQSNFPIKIKLNNGIVEAKKLIIATGGKSYASLGGSDKGYMLLQKLNIKMLEARQALCPLACKDDFNQIAGVRANARASLYIDGEAVMCEEGELQFTNYGVSGIMIFNMSSPAGKALAQHKKVSVFIDLLPKISKEEIIKKIRGMENRTICGALNGYLNDKLAAYIIEKNGIFTKQKVSACTDEDIDCLVNGAKKFTVRVVSLRDYEQAQVCAGGIALSEINSKTMELKSNGNIYVAGEVVDIDGKCGGYNLTFAILSGIRAGENAYASN